MRIFVFLFSLQLSNSVFASVVVEKIQMPAWLIHNQQKVVLQPGQVLQEDDHVITGNAAKVYLKLEEGSTIKLGEQSNFKVSSISKNKLSTESDDSVFIAAFDVIKGAFRFTTNKLFNSLSRNITINVGYVTAGIRGTDLWGKSNTSEDFVCLIEGRISVSKDNNELLLSEPGIYVSADKNKPMGETDFVDDNALKKWAATTEIEAESTFISKKGQFSVQLLSVVDRKDANRISLELNQAGYNSSVMAVIISGQEWFRVSVLGFETMIGAREFANSIDGQFSITGPWVNNRI